MTLTDWYWQYGVKRTDAKYRIPLDVWLEPVSKLERRMDTIRRNRDARPCVVLWGPSQTGKSTLLSRYLDYGRSDGSDSPLTWYDKCKVRFTETSESRAPESTVVFNPYNIGRDASGVATRYTLKSESDSDLDPRFPIEMKLVSHAQFIHALARGYGSECKPIQAVVTENVIAEMLKGSGDNVDRKAFEFLQDAVNVIELMQSGSVRFAPLAYNDLWDKDMRKRILSSDGLLSSEKRVRDFIARVFWDGADTMTEVYGGFLELREKLHKMWKDARIFMTPRVANLLLDIDTYEHYMNSRSNHEAGRICWNRQGNKVFLDIGEDGERLDGKEFGLFQALCGELVVPIRREALDNGTGRPLLHLLQKADLLDLPGLSHKDKNVAIEEAGNLDPSTLLQTVIKEGRTQSYVYSYAESYGVDAFVILVRSNDYPHKPDILNAGVKHWMRTFEAQWEYGRKAAMPLFIDMTFMGQPIRRIATKKFVAGNYPWQTVLDWVKSKLPIANPSSATFFATNYHQFEDGDISKLDSDKREEVIQGICKDPLFLKETGLDETTVRAVFEPDGGLDRMLERIAEMIDPGRRRSRCDEILKETRGNLLKLLEWKDLLPQDAATMAVRRQRLIDDFRNRVKLKIATGADLSEVASEIKNLFEARPEWFEPIPVQFAQLKPAVQDAFVKRQIDRWYDQKIAVIGATSREQEARDSLMAVVDALRDGISFDELTQVFWGEDSIMGVVNDVSDGSAARLSLAIAFGNILRTGNARVESKISSDDSIAYLNEVDQAKKARRNDTSLSPHYRLQIEPLLGRLDKLAKIAVAAMRPPQEGDNELAQIKKSL